MPLNFMLLAVLLTNVYLTNEIYNYKMNSEYSKLA